MNVFCILFYSVVMFYCLCVVGLHKSAGGDSSVFETPSTDISDARGRTASVTCLTLPTDDRPDRRVSDPTNGKISCYILDLFCIIFSLAYVS